MPHPVDELSPSRLLQELPSCMLRDRARLRQRIARAEQLLRQQRPAARLLGEIASDLAASQRLRTDRMLQRPRPTFAADLPIVQKKEQIAAAVHARRPGSLGF